MKASEMTNEELVSVLAEIPCNSWHDIDRETVHDICREAAARLRKTVELTPEIATDICRRESALRAKLKVAEDALEKCVKGMCIECRMKYPNGVCVNGCHDFLDAKDAIAAIREEGGAKK